MGYKEGQSLGKSGQEQTQFTEDKKQGHSIKDEMFQVASSSVSQPESTYSDFAQRQMV